MISRATSPRSSSAVRSPGIASPFFNVHRTRLVELAAKHRLPTIYHQKEFVVGSGCLMSYAADFRELFRRAAGYVNKILRGAKPADLPVEQPTKFQLVINLKTAKTFSGSCQTTFS